MKIDRQNRYRAIVTGMSPEGRGITHHNDKIVFLDNALPGEEVEFTYLQSHRKYATGIAINILQSSPDRVAPICPHYTSCGGCSLQHLAHAQQIKFKEQALIDQFHGIAKLELPTLMPAILGAITGYRYRARLTVKYVEKKGELLIGFHEKNGKYVNRTERCAILHPLFGEHLTALTNLINSLSISHFIPQIEIACGETTAAMILRNLQPFTADDYQLLQQFAAQYQILIYEQPGNLETIRPVTPPVPLTYKLLDGRLTLEFKPSNFTQINPTINPQLVNRVLELLQPSSTDQILDLFCGIGNFTLPLATRAQKVTGVEGCSSSIQMAQKNAHTNHLTNTEFYVTDLAKLPENSPWYETQYTKILLDPPRTGAELICQNIAKFNAKQIVYVSCNPATLARDAQILVAQGYQIDAAGIADMYPHTKHVEAIAAFSR